MVLYYVSKTANIFIVTNNIANVKEPAGVPFVCHKKGESCLIAACEYNSKGFTIECSKILLDCVIVHISCTTSEVLIFTVDEPSQTLRYYSTVFKYQGPEKKNSFCICPFSDCLENALFEYRSCAGPEQPYYN